MKIANYSDTVGSRWHFFIENEDTCCCGNHNSNTLNRRRIVKDNLKSIEHAKKKIEISIGQPHQDCLRKIKEIDGKEDQPQ